MILAFINFIFISTNLSEGYGLDISIQSYSNLTSDNLLLTTTSCPNSVLTGPNLILDLTEPCSLCFPPFLLSPF